MSEGPIKKWRESYAPPRVSTRPSQVAHAPGSEPGRAYCGRRNVAITGDATCADCLAAIRADAQARTHA